MIMFLLCYFLILFCNQLTQIQYIGIETNDIITNAAESTMATEVQTETQVSNVKLVLQKQEDAWKHINAIKDEGKKLKAKEKLLVESLKSFRVYGRARDAFDDCQMLSFLFMADLISTMPSNKYNMNWLCKKTRMPTSTAYRKYNAFKEKLEESGLTSDQYFEKLAGDIAKGVAVFKKEKVRLKKQLKFTMNDEINQYIDTELENFENEQAAEKVRKEQQKQEKQDEKDQFIFELAETIRVMKRKAKKDSSLLKPVSKAEELLVKLINRYEKAAEFDTTTPTTDEYKSLVVFT